MAISNAFKSAYQNEVSQRNKGISTITQGVKTAGTAIVGALGFTGALGSGALAEGAKHALAGKVGGVGGNIMLATLNEKTQASQDAKNNVSIFNEEDTGKVDTAFEQAWGEVRGTPQEEVFTTVWEQVERSRRRKQEKEVLEKVEEAYRNPKEE